MASASQRSHGYKLSLLLFSTFSSTISSSSELEDSNSDGLVPPVSRLMLRSLVQSVLKFSSVCSFLELFYEGIICLNGSSMS